jgi:HD-GYP domain-containing protein (c-di-GMP phosphodiesterase class II)/HAMP domain-containing protein
MLHLDTRTFRSRVARRIFTLFVACSLVPVAGFAVYSYLRVGEQLEAEGLVALGRDARSASTAVFERLLIARAQLLALDLGSATNAKRTEYAATSAFLKIEFRGLQSLDLAPEMLRRLETRGHSSFRVRAETTPPSFELLVSVDKGVLVGSLDPVFTFTPERRGPGERYWIADNSGRLVFAAANDTATESLLTSSPVADPREPFELQGPVGRELAIVWPLFLRVPFGAPDFHVGLSKSASEINRPLAEFKVSFPLAALFAAVIAIALALRQIRRTLVPLDALTQATRTLAAGQLGTRVQVESRDEFQDLATSFNSMATEIEGHIAALARLHEIGVALSNQEDLESLLGLIVDGAGELLDAYACALFLLGDESASGELRLEIERVRVDADSISLKEASRSFPSRSAHQAAISRQPVRMVRRAEKPPALRAEWDEFERISRVPIGELLALPLRVQTGQVVGVLVLLCSATQTNPEFSPESTRLAESLASQAATAIRQAQLVDGLRGMFEGLIALTVRAIDEKSPYTGDHCRKVPILTELIADAACETTKGPLKDLHLTEEERYELRIAALLHDCGKVVTPVHVMDKATKLERIMDRLELIRARGEILSRDIRIEELIARAPGSQKHGSALSSRSEGALAQIEDDLLFIQHCNIGDEFMAPESMARIRDIGRRYAWTDGNGETQSILTEDEVENLCISRGTLNDREREIISEHVVTTISLLEELPFPRELRNVPAIAGAHHERVDGSGFPHGLRGEQLTLQGRILGLADVFEALTAKDRPYKPGRTVTETLCILQRMVDEGHLDPDLHQALVEQKVHLRYAAEYLSSEQIDAEHLAEIESWTAPWEEPAES